MSHSQFAVEYVVPLESCIIDAVFWRLTRPQDLVIHPKSDQHLNRTSVEQACNLNMTQENIA